MIFGIYRERGGGLHLALWERRKRKLVYQGIPLPVVVQEEKVIYFSFGDRSFHSLPSSEFFKPVSRLTYPLDAAQVYYYLKYPVFRFTRIFP